jgi:tetratricopeptide (TPR) repeat protein
MQNKMSRERVRRLLGMTEQQLRRWEALGLIDRCDAYSLRDLAKLRKLSDLTGSGVSGSKLKKTIHALAMREQVEDPLSEFRIFATQSGGIQVEVHGQKMDAASGQFLMNFDTKPKPDSTTVAFPVARSAEASKKRGEAENWFERGLELEQTGAPQPEIRSAYEKAVSLDPDSTGALVNLGTLYFNSRALAKAEKFYLRAIEVDPNYALAHFNLGNLYDDRGEVAKAFHHYLEALRLHTAYPDAHYNLALLYQSQGNPMQAVQHWKSYLKLDPRSHWADIARRELDKLKEAAIVK